MTADDGMRPGRITEEQRLRVEEAQVDADPTGIPPPYMDPDINVVAKTDHVSPATPCRAPAPGEHQVTAEELGRVPPCPPPAFVAAEDLQAGNLLYEGPNGTLLRWRVSAGRGGQAPAFAAGEDIWTGDTLYADPRGRVWRMAPGRPWEPPPGAGKTDAELLTQATAELESAMGDLEAHLKEVRERIGAVVAVLDQTTIVAPAPKIGMEPDPMAPGGSWCGAGT